MSFSDAFPSAPTRLEEAVRARYPTLFAGEDWTLPFRAFLVRSDGHHLLVDADHVGWAMTAGAPFFPRARYVAAGEDWRFFSDRAESRDLFEEKLAPLAERGVVDLVDSKPTPVAPAAASVPSPGHTPGHMSVRVTGTERELVILGDVAVHPVQLEDPALAYTFDVDASRAAETRTALFAALARERKLVAAGHFPSSGIGYVGTTGAGFAWAPLEETP
jgi:glyoxylase-like metal-dependent hydrolase (beta-lactamase superfamily II)